MGGVSFKLNIEKPYPKQLEFFKAHSRFVAYGGARGGGKSWAARTKAVLLALGNPGIQILMLRRDLVSLRENHIYPLLKLTNGICDYKSSTRELVFPNKSRIVLGYCSADADVLQYQGQSYDVIFMEEATQFTEFIFQTLTESNRSSGLVETSFEPRMYFTCNPGGVGHAWVKRLFIERKYQKSEKPEDYIFIPSKVYDNPYIMEHSPDYVRSLENLPEERRRAMLDGDWDVVAGQYFSEFKRDIHVVRPFEIPKWYNRYIAIDYGLDMFACYCIARSESGQSIVYREHYEPDLIISEAAKKLKELKGDDEIISVFAPKDLWNRRQETGRSVADIFAEEGVFLTQVSGDRVHGWYAVKEALKVHEDENGGKTTGILFFETCTNICRTLPLLQYDEHKLDDVAKEPHELTHGPDAIRYYFMGRTVDSIPCENSGGYIDNDYETDELEEFLNYGG